MEWLKCHFHLSKHNWIVIEKNIKLNARKIGKTLKEEADQKKKPNGFEKNQTDNKKPNGFCKKQTVLKKPDKEDDEEEDKEDDILEEELKEETADVLQKYFIECIGSTNTIAIQECLSYLDDLPIEVIKMALKKTADVDGKWNYTKTILDDWLKRKINTVEKVETENLKFKKNKAKKDKNSFNANYIKRNYDNLDFLYANKGVDTT